MIRKKIFLEILQSDILDLWRWRWVKPRQTSLKVASQYLDVLSLDTSRTEVQNSNATVTCSMHISNTSPDCYAVRKLTVSSGFHTFQRDDQLKQSFVKSASDIPVCCVEQMWKCNANCIVLNELLELTCCYSFLAVKWVSFPNADPRAGVRSLFRLSLVLRGTPGDVHSSLKTGPDPASEKSCLLTYLLHGAQSFLRS